MASFHELWGQSRAFRQLFLLNKVFPTSKHYDLGKAEHFWYDRWPQVEWGFCAQEGCVRLMPEGALCGFHCKEHGMPKWAWSGGVLYRYLCTHIGKNGKQISGKGDEWHYQRYVLFQAAKIYGNIPDRFTVYYRDQNPFNLRLDNLFVMSRVAKQAIETGLLSYGQGVRMDEELGGFYGDIGGKGRPSAMWSYNYVHIASAAQVRVERVRQEVSRGRLVPGDLRSVIEFCCSVGKSGKGKGGK